MNRKFKLSFVLSSIIILVANVFYVFSQVPPDGRWVTQLPVTSIFAIVYLAIIYFVAKQFKDGKQQNALILLLNLIVVFSFFLFGSSFEYMFQNVNSFYISDYIAVMPYIIFYGVGILVYFGTAKMLSTKKV